MCRWQWFKCTYTHAYTGERRRYRQHKYTLWRLSGMRVAAFNYRPLQERQCIRCHTWQVKDLF